MIYDFEGRYVNYHINGLILEARYKPGILIVNLEMAKQIVEERIKFQAGRNFLLLLIAEHDLVVEKKARDYFASQAGINGLIAIAIVVKLDLISLTVADFMIRVQKPAIPTKLYRDIAEGRKWLLQKVETPV